MDRNTAVALLDEMHAAGVAAMTDGIATIDGVDWTWSTAGLYRVRSGRITACWLLPLGQGLFEEENR